MPYRVEVDREECVSGGKCVANAPAGFALDAEGLSETLPDLDTLPGELLRKVARERPGQAILLFDEDDNEVDPFG